MKRVLSAAALAALAILSACGGGGGSQGYSPGGSSGAAQVVVTPSTLDFTELGVGQSVTVFQSTVTLSYTESDDCSGVAVIEYQSVASGTAAYDVAATGAGGCTAIFRGSGQNTGTLTITSSPLGSVSPSPSSFSFLGTGASYAQSLTVTQSGFTGTFTQSNDCSGIVKITTTSNSGGTGVYDVEPSAAGSCQITLNGGSDESAIVGVMVTTTDFGIQ